MEQAYGMAFAALNMLQASTKMLSVAENNTTEEFSGTSDFKELLQQKTADSTNVKDDKTTDDSGDSNVITNDTEDAPESNFALAQEMLAAQWMPVDVVITAPDQTAVPEADAAIAVVQQEPEILLPATETVVVETEAFTNIEGAVYVQPGATGQLVTEETVPDTAAKLPPELQPLETTQTVQTTPVTTELTEQIEHAVEQPQEEGESLLSVEKSVDVKPAETEEPTQQKDLDVSAATETPLFKNVETVPVKVAEAENPAEVFEADTDSVALQIDDKLIDALKNGESKVTIQLNPEFLGSVTVEFSQNSDGIMQVVLSAQSAQTQNLLEKHAPFLQGLLADRGQAAQVEVQQPQENQQSNQQQNFQDGGQNSGHGGQRQEHRQQPQPNEDFLHQLRLGLIPMEEVS